MASYRIDYYQVLEQATSIDDLAGDLGREIQNLENIYNSIREDWNGPASSEYRKQLISLISDMRGTCNSMPDLASTIRSVASSIQEEDERQAELEIQAELERQAEEQRKKELSRKLAEETKAAEMMKPLEQARKQENTRIDDLVKTTQEKYSAYIPERGDVYKPEIQSTSKTKQNIIKQKNLQIERRF